MLLSRRQGTNVRDIFADFSQHDRKWNPAGHAAQTLLAVHRTIIETFISLAVVREGMSINGAHSHHWNFGETTVVLGSFPCQGQARFAKVSSR